jgi:polysaccharide pyruvyl transferase CsaB
MSDLQAVLCGYYGEGNGGDEALLVSMLEMLPTNVKPLVLSANPQQTMASYGVQAVDRKSLQVLTALRSSQVLILGGGSLIQDATSIRNSIYYGGIMGLAQQLGLQTIAIGQGIGPLNQPITRWIAKRAFGSCAALTVRDAASAFILQEWSISCMMAPDPVWNLDAAPVPELANLPTPRIAITLRSHAQLTPARFSLLTQALVDVQKATNSFILIVPFQPSTDLAMSQELQAQLPGVSQIVTMDDPKKLKGVFQGVQLAIGMRFHSLIMAAAEGCRCFALSYDPKVTQLMSDLQMPGWELAHIPIAKEQIAEAWLHQFTHGEPLTGKQLQDLKTRTSIHQKLLAAALQN